MVHKIYAFFSLRICVVPASQNESRLLEAETCSKCCTFDFVSFSSVSGCSLAKNQWKRQSEIVRGKSEKKERRWPDFSLHDFQFATKLAWWSCCLAVLRTYDFFFSLLYFVSIVFILLSMDMPRKKCAYITIAHTICIRKGERVAALHCTDGDMRIYFIHFFVSYMDMTVLFRPRFSPTRSFPFFFFVFCETRHVATIAIVSGHDFFFVFRWLFSFRSVRNCSHATVRRVTSTQNKTKIFTINFVSVHGESVP